MKANIKNWSMFVFGIRAVKRKEFIVAAALQAPLQRCSLRDVEELMPHLGGGTEGQ